ESARSTPARSAGKITSPIGERSDCIARCNPGAGFISLRQLSPSPELLRNSTSPRRGEGKRRAWTERQLAALQRFGAKRCSTISIASVEHGFDRRGRSAKAEGTLSAA